MYNPTKDDIIRGLEIRIRYLKNRIGPLKRSWVKQKVENRDARLVRLKHWTDYMSTTSPDEIIVKLNDKLKVAEQELIKVRMNDN